MHKAGLSLGQMLPLVSLLENLPLPHLDPQGHETKLWEGTVCEDISSWSIFPSLCVLFPHFSFLTSSRLRSYCLGVTGGSSECVWRMEKGKCSLQASLDFAF